MSQAELQIALDANAFTRFVGYGLPEKATKRANIMVDEAIVSNAKRIVFDCESFQEFQDRSGLPHQEAVDMWETAWENYETEEARATGN